MQQSGFHHQSLIPLRHGRLVHDLRSRPPGIRRVRHTHQPHDPALGKLEIRPGLLKVHLRRDQPRADEIHVQLR